MATKDLYWYLNAGILDCGQNLKIPRSQGDERTIRVFYLLCMHMATKYLCWYLHAGISGSGQNIKMSTSRGYKWLAPSINLSMKFQLLKKPLKY